MPKSNLVKFNIPTKKGMEVAKGEPIWIRIGSVDIKFIIQREGRVPRYLTHYDSGRTFGSIGEAMVELTCKLSPYHEITPERAAEFLVAKMVNRIGIKRVLKTLANAKVINHA